MLTMTLYKNSDDWDDFKQKIQQLKSSIDPRFLLESLGFKVTRETPKELRGACRIHGGDNKQPGDRTHGARYGKLHGIWSVDGGGSQTCNKISW